MGLALLASIPVGGDVGLDTVLAALRASGASVRSATLVSHASRYTHSPQG